MANPDHVEIVKRGRTAINQWIAVDGDLNSLDLSGADLHNADLRWTDLRHANFNRANLSGANLNGANLLSAFLNGADLSHASLVHANLTFAALSEANLSHADLMGANFLAAHLVEANLNAARFHGANLHGALVNGADFTGASFKGTSLGDVDLSNVKGLDLIQHDGPSSVGIDMLIANPRLPDIFLRGCGFPDIFIDYIRSLTNEPIQYYSCFISYSTKDQDFAQRLWNDLQAEGVRCWFAPEDIQGGKKIHEQIDEAIRIYDKLLLILSAHSMASEWVKTEIAKVRKREIEQGRKMLFPVRLIGFETLKQWECFDADTGKDSAREIREYYIPDFSEWKTDQDTYKSEFAKLLRDLKADANPLKS